MDDQRPKWGFKLTESQVRKLNSTIVKVTHHWEVTGCDTSRDWVTFHGKNSSFEAPQGWDKLFSFTPYWAGLIRPNYEGKKAIKKLSEIDSWDKNNSDERKELERLQTKFNT